MEDTQQAQQGFGSGGAATTNQKKRNPVIAFFLSLFFPGVGQLYNGEPGKFAAVLAISFAWSAALIFYDPFSSFRSASVHYGLSFLFPFLVAGEAAFAASRLGKVELKKFNRVWIYVAGAIIPTLLLALIPNTNKNYHSFNVSVPFMEPTVRSGEMVMVRNAGADKSVPFRGDIIVFRSRFDEKREAGKGSYFMMRVVGLPGETIEIRNRTILINNRPLENSMFKAQSANRPAAGKADNFGPLEIPPGSYFVLGDSYLKGSGILFFVTVPLSDIAGKAAYIVISDDWDRIGEQLDKGTP
jgi:signal peptidase I